LRGWQWKKPQPLRGKVFFNGVSITKQQTQKTPEGLRIFCFLSSQQKAKRNLPSALSATRAERAVKH
jgi:hypothetical protein